MSLYPVGAGPEAAAFGGDIWMPPVTPPGAVSTGGTPGQAATTPGPAGTAYASTVLVQSYVIGGTTQYSYAYFPGPADRSWLVRRILLLAPDLPGNATVYLTKQTMKEILAKVDANKLYPISATHSGDMDENEANPPYAVAAGWNLLIVWDANAGTVRTDSFAIPNWARVEYDEV